MLSHTSGSPAVRSLTRPSPRVCGLSTDPPAIRPALRFHSNSRDTAMASENPSPEDKLRYDAAKKELMQALAKRREVDKHLVRLRHATRFFVSHSQARHI